MALAATQRGKATRQAGRQSSRQARRQASSRAGRRPCSKAGSSALSKACREGAGVRQGAGQQAKPLLPPAGLTDALASLHGPSTSHQHLLLCRRKFCRCAAGFLARGLLALATPAPPAAAAAALVEVLLRFLLPPDPVEAALDRLGLRPCPAAPASPAASPPAVAAARRLRGALLLLLGPSARRPSAHSSSASQPSSSLLLQLWLA